MATVVEWIMTAVVALTGGTIGGVILAPKISWRSEQGRRRYEAETTIRKALETYRSTMAYRRREITIKQSYPAEYASTASQEQLAETIVGELPYLPRRQRELLRRHLVVLVGQWGVGHADERVSVPESVRSPQSEDAWHHQRIAELAESGDLDAFGEGQLGQVRKNLVDQDSYEAAISTLDTMIALSPPVHDTARTIGGWRKKQSERRAIERRLAALEESP